MDPSTSGKWVSHRPILSVPCMRLGKRMERAAYTQRQLFPAILYPGRADGAAREQGVLSPFFGGLIFEVGQDVRGGLISPRCLGMSGPSTRKGWGQALDWMFRESANIDSALRLSRHLPDGLHLDIWLALPYPPRNQKQPFGMVDNRRICFALRPEDRFSALRWWIEQALERWELLSSAVPGHRGRLQGFVWLKTYLDSEDIRLVNQLAQWAHEREKRLMWCPNYGTTHAHQRDVVPFDDVFIRPTYYGFGQRGEEWVKTAAQFSANHGLGMVCWIPDGTPARLLRWLQMGKAHMVGAPHLFELGDWRNSKLLDPEADHYHALYAYVREMDETGGKWGEMR